MKKLLIAAALIAIALALPVVPAQAQFARTFVSAATGSDANDCSRLTPCRTFPTAHDSTLANGEITVLDPGGYGAVEITKAISIVNDGVGEAGVLVSGGATGITVTAAATAPVNLRGITVQGIGFGGGKGIRFNSGAALTVTNCAIRNHTGTNPTETPYDQDQGVSVPCHPARACSSGRAGPGAACAHLRFRRRRERRQRLQPCHAVPHVSERA